MYTGPISYGKRPNLVRRAYDIWATQRKRCSNPRSKDYAHYGAKGIRVEYTSAEFVAWFLEHAPKFKGEMLTVGRKDHNKSYSFRNIRLENNADNARERIVRAGNPNPGCRVLCFQQGRRTKVIYASLREAERATGVNGCRIKELAKNGKRSARGYVFKLLEAL